MSVNGDRLLLPASTMKLITLAIAAEQLGWDFTYETRLLANGTIEEGVLDGDLIVVGSGDPTLDDWEGGATIVFRSWAERLRTMGIRRVTGSVIGDGRAFPGSGYGAGWMWDDMTYAYSAPVSALQFNQNAAQVRIAPGPAAGTPATVALSPAYADVDLHAMVMTDAPDAGVSVEITPSARTRRVEVSGVVPLRPAPVVRTVAVSNPTLYYARAVREGLREAGIVVQGEALDIDTLPESPALDRALLVATHRSPTLAALADPLMKLSQNQYAETLMRTVALARSGIGTFEDGRTIAREVLDRWGIAPAETIFLDASGLSRYDLITPRAFVALLAQVYADDRLREPFLASLPVAGRAGTLSQRMKGTAAEGTVRAKTGSYTNARAIAGFARTADGEPVAFSIAANNYGVSSDAIDRLSDAVIVALSEFRRTRVH